MSDKVKRENDLDCLLVELPSEVAQELRQEYNDRKREIGRAYQSRLRDIQHEYLDAEAKAYLEACNRALKLIGGIKRK
jgi:hypothetical protein